MRHTPVVLSRACAVLFALTAWAHAGSFTATPVKLTIASGATSTSLSLDNVGDEPVLVQAEVVAWSQRDGKDVLTPSEDLVVSPPIFKVAPGSAQTVRVGVLNRPTSEREITYRLFLQEVPQPPRPGQQGVSVALRLGLPVFLLPRSGAEPRVSWHARAQQKELALTLRNTGTGHVQALQCKLFAEDGTLLAEQDLGAYVLAGQERTWTLRLQQPWRGGKLTLAAQTTAGDLSAVIVPE